MTRHQSRKGGQLGQQALLKGTQRGLSMRISGAGHQTSSLRGGGWKLWGWQLDENLGGAPLYCPSRTATVLPKWGERGEAERPAGRRVGAGECGGRSSPPRGGAGGGALGERTTTPGPHPGGRVGGHQEGNLRCWWERTARPQVGPKGPQPAQGAGGVWGYSWGARATVS